MSTNGRPAVRRKRKTTKKPTKKAAPKPKAMLGKISAAYWGTSPNAPNMYGLRLELRSGSVGVAPQDLLVNMTPPSKDTPYDADDQQQALYEMTSNTLNLMRQCKVHSVAQLVGKPVEMIVVGNKYQSFRVLTEVL